MDQPLVSIGIPNYNYGRYLRQCIDSVLQQTYSNIECVVVDNGSKDDSREIVHSYNDPRLRFIQQPQTVPMYANWDTAWQSMSGEFVKLLQSDDWLQPTYVESAVACFLNSDVDLVFSGWLLVDETLGTRNETHSDVPASGPIRGTEKFRFVYQLGSCVQPTNWLFRRQAAPFLRFSDVPPAYGTPFSLDMVLWARMMIAARAVQMVARPLAAQRLHATNDRKSRISSSSLHETIIALNLMRALADPSDYPIIDAWKQRLAGHYILYGLKHLFKGNGEILRDVMRHLRNHGMWGSAIRGTPGAAIRRIRPGG